MRSRSSPHALGCGGGDASGPGGRLVGDAMSSTSPMRRRPFPDACGVTRPRCRGIVKCALWFFSFVCFVRGGLVWREVDELRNDGLVFGDSPVEDVTHTRVFLAPRDIS